MQNKVLRPDRCRAMVEGVAGESAGVCGGQGEGGISCLLCSGKQISCIVCGGKSQRSQSCSSKHKQL